MFIPSLFRVVLVVVLCGSSLYCSAQGVGFDFYIAKSKSLLNENAQLAESYLDSALTQATKNNHQEQVGIAMNQKGIMALRKGLLDSSRYFYLKSIKFLENEHDSLRVKPLKNLGVVSYFQGDIEEAIALHEEVLSYYLSVHNNAEVARIYSNIGVFQKNSGKFIMALKTYIKAAEYFERMGDELGLANINNNIGSIYIELERPEEALTYFQRAIEQEANANNADRAIWNNNMAIAMREIGHLDSALLFEENALRYNTLLGDSSGIAQSYLELGMISMTRADYANARGHLQKSLNLARRIGDHKYIAVIANNLAEVEVETKNPNRALEILRSDKDRGYQLQSEAVKHHLKAKAHHQLGQHRQALKHLKQYSALNDSLRNKTVHLQLDELNALYNSNEQEKTIREQELAIALAQTEFESDMRAIIVLGFAVLLIVIGTLIYLRYQNLLKSRLLLESKVNIAKSQLSPEFLFESLDIVKELVVRQPVLAEQAVYKLSRLYQKMVENFDEDIIPLEEDLNLLQLYMDLVSMKAGNSFDITNDILSPDKYAVVPFSLQTLFENAINSKQIAVHHTLKLYENENSLIVENQTTGELVGSIISKKTGFPFIDEKYKMVCGHGIAIEQPGHRLLIKIPKIELTI